MGVRENERRILQEFWKHKLKFWKFHVWEVILWNLTFIFSGSKKNSHKKFSLVLLEMTNYIFSPKTI